MTDFSNSFIAVDPQVVFKKGDRQDPRIGDLYNQNQDSPFVLAGYPDDEGISLNGGRLGAAKAPDIIRNFLSRMTPSPPLEKFPSFFDIGNIDENLSLENKHEQIQKTAKFYLKKNKKWIGLGGGHDFGYPDCAAFLEVYQSDSPIVFNFDAHLDVRPLDKGLSSGTPFYRLLTNYKNFDFIEVGIQDVCNSETHLLWSQSKNARIINLEDLYSPSSSPLENFQSHILTQVPRVADKKTKRPAFISLDIDVFSSSYAMGCSQSWPMGMSPMDFNSIFYWTLQQYDVRGIGVYEVSPPLDLDNRTSKLAAQIIYNFLKYNSGVNSTPSFKKSNTDHE